MMRLRAKTNRRRVNHKERIVTSGRKVGRTMLMMVLVAGLAAGLPILGYLGYRGVLSSGYFCPKQVRVMGNVRVDEEQILEASGVLAGGSNLVEYDTADAEERIEALAWVAEATVETTLPDTVTIRVRERELLGVVRDQGFFLVDVEGTVIEPWTAQAPITLSESPIVTGTGLQSGSAWARARALEAFDIAQKYAAMGLDRWGSLAEVHYDVRLGYTLFAGETEIRLGRDRFEERLRRLWQVQVVLEQRGTRAEYVLLDMQNDIDRVAVKPWPKVSALAPTMIGMQAE